MAKKKIKAKKAEDVTPKDEVTEKNPVGHPKDEEERKTDKTAMWIFLFAVVLVVGAGVGYYLLTLKGPGTETTTTTITTTIATTVTGGAVAGKVVTLDYLGKYENGTVFDTSLADEATKAGIYLSGRTYSPFSLVVGKGQVISGFDEAILGMKVGEEKEFTIPPAKGYTDPQHPLYGKTLIFKVWIKKIEDPVKIQMTVVNDPKCSSCDTSQILAVTENLFPGAQVTEVDSSSTEGKVLIKKYNIIFLPAYIFDEALATAANYASQADVFEKVSDKYLLKADVTGAKYYASAEAQKKAEELAKKAAETKCASIAKKDKPELDAFIVSNCPYGLQMQRVLVPVMNALSSSANIKIRYIGSVSGNTIISMHGDTEAQENLRQICLREEQSDKFVPYISCYMKAGKTDDCLTEAKVDKTKLTTCMTDTTKGIAYAKEDFALQAKYSVSGSPTMIFNGAQASEFDFGGRTAEAVKTMICCGFNTKPLACSTTLDTRSAATSFAAEYSSAQTTSTGSSCG